MGVFPLRWGFPPTQITCRALGSKGATHRPTTEPSALKLEGFQRFNPPWHQLVQQIMREDLLRGSLEIWGIICTSWNFMFQDVSGCFISCCIPGWTSGLFTPTPRMQLFYGIDAHMKPEFAEKARLDLETSWHGSTQLSSHAVRVVMGNVKMPIVV